MLTVNAACFDCLSSSRCTIIEFLRRLRRKGISWLKKASNTNFIRWFFVFHQTVCALKNVHCMMQLDSGRYSLSEQTRQKRVLSDVLDWLIVTRITISRFLSKLKSHYLFTFEFFTIRRYLHWCKCELMWANLSYCDQIWASVSKSELKKIFYSICIFNNFVINDSKLFSWKLSMILYI